MSLSWEGEDVDAARSQRAHDRLVELKDNADGPVTVIANEFAEVHVSKVVTRNGARLLIESRRSGQWITVDPLELESLTWQNDQTFSAMVGHPYGPLFGDDGDDR